MRILCLVVRLVVLTGSAIILHPQPLVAVPLPPIPPASGPDAFVTLPGTTAAAEPVLGGVVQFDKVTPWVFGSFKGAVQIRVVKSTSTGEMAFYYRIMNNAPPGQKVRTFFIQSPTFNGISADVNFRTDGLGTVAPRQAIRKKAGTSAAGEIGFSFSPGILPGQSSRFFFIRTSRKSFVPTGAKLDIVIQAGTPPVGGSPGSSQRLDAPEPARVRPRPIKY